MQGEELRILAWCGDDSNTDGRIARALKSIAVQANAGKIFGLWRYRVVNMDGDRVQLQAISKAAGLPDILPIAMHAGFPGMWARLSPGSEVAVSFLEGDPRLPVITGFSPKGSTGFVPVEIVIGDDSSALAGARRGDLVQCGGPGTVVTFMGPGAPPNAAVVVGVPYSISFSVIPTPQAPLYGAIMTGSGLLRFK